MNTKNCHIGLQARHSWWHGLRCAKPARWGALFVLFCFYQLALNGCKSNDTHEPRFTLRNDTLYVLTTFSKVASGGEIPLCMLKCNSELILDRSTFHMNNSFGIHKSKVTCLSNNLYHIKCALLPDHSNHVDSTICSFRDLIYENKIGIIYQSADSVTNGLSWPW